MIIIINTEHDIDFFFFTHFDSFLTYWIPREKMRKHRKNLTRDGSTEKDDKRQADIHTNPDRDMEGQKTLMKKKKAVKGIKGIHGGKSNTVENENGGSKDKRKEIAR